MRNFFEWVMLLYLIPSLGILFVVILAPTREPEPDEAGPNIPPEMLHGLGILTSLLLRIFPSDPEPWCPDARKLRGIAHRCATIPAAILAAGDPTTLNRSYVLPLLAAFEADNLPAAISWAYDIARDRDAWVLHVALLKPIVG